MPAFSNTSILARNRGQSDWEAVATNCTLLSKRRAQKQVVIVAVVQEAQQYLSGIEDKELKYKLLEALRSIADGKLFLERELAELTQMLSQMKEAEGKIAEAADILQVVHVETYGSMNKHEKAEYILEQVRLMLAKKDYVRAAITAKKVSAKVLAEPGFEDVKVKFYTLMIEHHTHEDSIIDLFRDNHAIYDTKTVQEAEDKAQCKTHLEAAVIYLMLSAHDNERNDMLHRICADKRVTDEYPIFKAMLTHFITMELAPYPLPEDATLMAHPIFTGGGERATKMKTLLHKRVVQHNIRVLAGYYSRTSMSHMSTMLGLSMADTEDFISELVVEGAVWARIDRPSGVCNFKKPEPANEAITNWSSDIAELLEMVRPCWQKPQPIRCLQCLPSFCSTGGKDNPLDPKGEHDEQNRLDPALIIPQHIIF
jgi:26S proteasome regulatory subunit N5